MYLTQTDRFIVPGLFHTGIVLGVVFLTACLYSVTAFFVSFGLFELPSGERIPELFSAHVPLGIAGVGLALSTQVGGFSLRQTDTSNPGISPVGLIAQIGNVASYGDTFLSDHFDAIDAYANLLSVDLPTFVRESEDPGLALDAYIDELAYRRDDAVNRLVDIGFEQSVLADEVTSLEEQISAYQNAISNGYDSRDEYTITDALTNIEQLRATQTDSRSRLLFLQRFQSDYETLIAATYPYLATLRANREVISSGIQVQVTSDTAGILESLNVLNYQQ